MSTEINRDMSSSINPNVLEMDRVNLKKSYLEKTPFPHVVIDDFLRSDRLQRVIREFPDVDRLEWISLIHTNEKKFINQNPSSWGLCINEIVEDLMSDPFVSFLSDITGIEEIVVDPSFQGGGLAVSQKGGFLNIHADFTVHPYQRNWKRRLNLLLYLNEDWKPEYGGDLELWSTDMKRCVSKVAPIANRVLIFSTDEDSFHGHPEPLACPDDRARKSLALYYFSEEVDPYIRSTEYRSRPGDGLGAFPIFIDKEILRGYDKLKRKFGFSEELASKILDWRSRLRSKRGKS